MYPEWLMYAVAQSITADRYREAERSRIAVAALGGRRRLSWRRSPQRRPESIPAPRRPEPAESPLKKAA